MSLKVVRVAVEGCCHGELNRIYSELSNVDLLIIGGDFQAIRNKTDLQTMSVPKKYLRMGDFHEYYSGKRTAPVLTIFVGGNHECMLYLRELEYGGWVAPNIYYLGSYGAVWFRGLRICGMSGIYNAESFRTTPIRYKLPFDSKTLRSVYHTKPKAYLKMLLNQRCDIALSHDWPTRIWNYGDVEALIRKKPFLAHDIKTGRMGSTLAENVLPTIEPRYWFSLHMHVRFSASVPHQEAVNGEEIELSMDSKESLPRLPPRTTEFLALDKCLPKRQYLEIKLIKPETVHPSLDLDSLFYDARAVALHKVIDKFAKNSKKWSLLTPHKLLTLDIDLTLFELDKAVSLEVENLQDLDFEIPRNFAQVAPTSDDENVPLCYWPNNQTNEFCDKFGLARIDPELV